MTDLVLRPYKVVDGHVTKWAFQMRRTGMPETEYITLATGDEAWAREIVEAEAPAWLFGDPSNRLQAPTGASAIEIAQSWYEYWEHSADRTEDNIAWLARAIEAAESRGFAAGFAEAREAGAIAVEKYSPGTGHVIRALKPSTERPE